MDKKNESIIVDATTQLQRLDLTSAERTDLFEKIQQTQEDTVKRNRNAVLQKAKSAKYSNLIKRAVLVGQILLITDMFGRIYVYHTLGRDPTISPTLTYIINTVN